jgi:hypothetical protein
MPAPEGKRTSLASYSWRGWGGQSGITQFRDVFQPDRGSFSPGYPLVPPEREQVRLWDYPVCYNTIYTPRAYEAIGFDELRALAENHDITGWRSRPAKIKSKSSNGRSSVVTKNRPGPTPPRGLIGSPSFGEAPTVNSPSRRGCARRSRTCSCSTPRHSNYAVTAAAMSSDWI